MQKIAIVTDSNSGITQAQSKQLGVWVLPTYALACHLGRRLGMRRLT